MKTCLTRLPTIPIAFAPRLRSVILQIDEADPDFGLEPNVIDATLDEIFLQQCGDCWNTRLCIRQGFLRDPVATIKELE